MSVSDPGEKIEWGADSEPQKNERVPSSGLVHYRATLSLILLKEQRDPELLDLRITMQEPGHDLRLC